MSTLPFAAFDADNHYYEALDAFTRHLDPEIGPRAVQWVQIGSRQRLLVAGKLHSFIANPTFDPILAPGALHDFFRGINPERRSMREAWGELRPIDPAYRDRDARLAVLDDQGLAAVWLFPTLGVGIEAGLVDDPAAAVAAFHAFNRWLEDDWGYAYENRIFAAPYVTLADPAAAERELDRVLSLGAKVLVMRPAPAFTAEGPCSPADPRFDGFWARVAEAGVPVAVHSGDSGYGTNGYSRDGAATTFGNPPPIRAITAHLERPIMDFLGALACDRLFERHPGLRIVSVENGSGFLPQLFSLLRKVGNQRPDLYQESPADQLREHLWVSPFWEDDVHAVVELLGADRVLLGSDWPHAEGLARPTDFVHELTGLDDAAQRQILRDNVIDLGRHTDIPVELASTP